MTPCAEGRNFSNCPSFANGKARRPESLKRSHAPEKSCPKCDKKDNYDGNTTRMVKDVRQGIKVGTGPSRSDPGVDMCFESREGLEKVVRPVICCSVM